MRKGRERMSTKGWVSVHRQIQDHWLWKDKPFARGQAWLDLLMMANHEDKKFVLGNELIKCERGQIITSIRQLCDRWGWSNTKVVSFLKLLQDDEMVTYFSDTKKTVVTILKYSFYQQSSDTEATEKHNENDTEATRKHTNNNYNNYNNVNKDVVEGVPSPETNLDKVPSQCQKDDPVLIFLNQVSSYYTTLTNRLPGSNDHIAISDISNLTIDFELVKQAMDESKQNFKPKYDGDVIRSFKYFIPAIKTRVAAEQTKKEGGKADGPAPSNAAEYFKQNKNRFLYKAE